METDVVCVGWYRSAPEAELARGRLANEGISALMTGVTEAELLGAIPSLTNGQIRLEVAERDAERARAVLDAPAICPACGAQALEIRRERPPRASGIRRLLQFLEAPVVRRACTACGYETVEDEDSPPDE